MRSAGPMLGNPTVLDILARRQAGLPGMVFDSQEEKEVLLFSTLHSVQSVLAALLLRVQRLEHVADLSPQSIADVKEWSCTLLLHMPSCGAKGRLCLYTSPGIVTSVDLRSADENGPNFRWPVCKSTVKIRLTDFWRRLQALSASKMKTVYFSQILVTSHRTAHFYTQLNVTGVGFECEIDETVNTCRGLVE
jgi:hypothetical protein